MALLDPAQAKEARIALTSLSGRLLSLPPGAVAGPSLADGHAGIALAHATLDAVLPGQRHANAARRAVEHAVQACTREPLRPSLYFGFPGITWAAELLSGNPSVGPEADPLSPVDDVLETHVASSPWRGGFDLTGGLAGICVYALERVHRASARRILARAVELFATLAVRCRPGLAWAIRPKRSGSILYNLGVPHGVPGVIGVLTRILSAGLDETVKRKARALLEGAIEWLLAQELPSDADGCFAWAVGPGVPREPARVAWCYGDPGIATNLILAARAAREPAWERAGRRIARRASQRRIDQVRIVDASLCHGTAGVAHMFHRLYRLTRDERLAEVARFWFGRTLAMRSVRRGFAGFAAYRSNPGSTGRPAALGWYPDPGFLLGGAGVALALAFAISGAEPTWDRVLLLS